MTFSRPTLAVLAAIAVCVPLLGGCGRSEPATPPPTNNASSMAGVPVDVNAARAGPLLDPAAVRGSGSGHGDRLSIERRPGR